MKRVTLGEFEEMVLLLVLILQNEAYMINIQKELKTRKLSARMISTVHDELVFEAPPAEKKKVTDLVRSKMEEAVPLTVPIDVSVKIGKNWLDMEEV